MKQDFSPNLHQFESHDQRQLRLVRNRMYNAKIRRDRANIAKKLARNAARLQAQSRQLRANLVNLQAELQHLATKFPMIQAPFQLHFKSSQCINRSQYLGTASVSPVAAENTFLDRDMDPPLQAHSSSPPQSHLSQPRLSKRESIIDAAVDGFQLPCEANLQKYDCFSEVGQKACDEATKRDKTDDTWLSFLKF